MRQQLISEDVALQYAATAFKNYNGNPNSLHTDGQIK